MRGTYGLLCHNLLKFRQGEALPTKALNSLVDSVERARPLTGAGSGISLVQTSNGTAFRQTGIQWVAKGILSGALAKYTGSGVYPSQNFVIDQFNGTAFVSTGVTAKVYNDHTDKGVVTGVRITVIKIDGFWFLDDVPDCANLTP